VDLFEEIRREYEFGVASISGVARKFGVPSRERPSPDGSRAREGAASTSAAVTAGNRAKAAVGLGRIASRGAAMRW
jgi:hypothetical protein